MTAEEMQEEWRQALQLHKRVQTYLSLSTEERTDEQLKQITADLDAFINTFHSRRVGVFNTRDNDV